MIGRNNNDKMDKSAGAAPGATSARVSDERIRENVEAHLLHAAQGHSESVDVIVEVQEGNVTLLGTVPHSVMKHQIEEMAASCAGVRRVENKLNVPLTAAWPGTT